MATKARLECLIDKDVKEKAKQDAQADDRSLSNHVERVLKAYPEVLPKPYVPKQQYES